MDGIALYPTVDAFITAYEDAVSDKPQVAMPCRNVIFGGCFVRELLIPKWTMATGAAYKKDHIAIQVYGDMSILKHDGSEDRIRGYNIFLCPAGTRKMGYAHEDSFWLSILPTECTEINDVILECIDASKTDLKKLLDPEKLKLIGV